MIFEAKELKKLAYYDTETIGHIDLAKIQRIYDIYNVIGLTENKIDIKKFILCGEDQEQIELTKQERAYLKDHPIIKAHNESTWPPFNYNENGVAKGFSIDYMNLLAQKLDIEVEYISGYSWNEFMDILPTSKLDIIINIAKNEERAKTITFTDIFYSTQNAIYTNINNNSFISLHDLKGKTIAMPKGFFTQKHLEKYYPDIKQMLVRNSLEALKLLSLGKVDATIGKKAVMDYIIENNNIPNIIATQYINDERLTSHMRIGAAKKDQILIDILNKAQKHVRHNELKKIKQRWFGVKKHEKSDLTTKEKKYLQTKTPIKFCIDPGWTPIEYLSNGTAKGISIDTLQVIAGKVNTKFEFVKTSSWNQSQKFLKQKKCDILPSVIETDQRKKYANFTKPYLSYDLAIITKDDKPLVASLDSVVTKKMSRKEGSGLINKLKKEYPDIDIKETKSMQESLEDVVNDKVYFTIATPAVFAYYKNKYKLDNLHIAGYTRMKYNLCIAVRDDDIVLLNVLNKALAQIPEEIHNLIYEKWLNINIVQEIDYDLIWMILATVLLFALIMVYYQNRLSVHNKELEKQKVKLEEANHFLNLGQEIANIGAWNLNHATGELNWTHGVHNIFETNDKDFKITFESFIKFTHPDDKEKLRKAYDDSIEDRSNYFVEHKIVTDDGNIKYVEQVGHHFFDDNDEIYRSTGAVLDITQRKEAEIKLEDLNKNLEKKIQKEVSKNIKKDQQLLAQSRLAQMGEMISMIAHQWRQPLSAINSTAINLKMRLSLDSYDLENKKAIKECKKFVTKELDDIEYFVKNLTTTIDDFRDFYKPNKKSKIVNINQLIQKAMSIIKTSLDQNHIKYYEEYNSDKDIDIYDSEMMQVFLNILKNAQDNFKDKDIINKTITIKTQDLPNGVKISISDNGGGIPHDIMPKIFDPYFSTKSEKNGTGLGLHMSRIIVQEHHNGSLEVVNKDDGVCFDIMLLNKKV